MKNTCASGLPNFRQNQTRSLHFEPTDLTLQLLLQAVQMLGSICRLMHRAYFSVLQSRNVTVTPLIIDRNSWATFIKQETPQ
jgi:hypothetical protein